MSLGADGPPHFSGAGEPRAERRRGRLVIVTNTLLYGGAETQVSALARGLAGRGWATTVLSISKPRQLVEELEAAGVSVRYLRGAQKYHKVIASPWLVKQLWALRPDVVHSHVYRANIYTRSARPFTRVPVLICTAHNIAEGTSVSDEPGAAERIYRRTDRFGDLTTNVSRAAVARYVRLGAAPEDRIRYVPNGIDFERFRPDHGERARMRAELGLTDEPTLLAVGRFTEQKDYPAMVGAFRRVHEAMPETRLLLVGGGALEDAIRQQVSELGLVDAIHFLGQRPDVPAIMNAADLYLMSSRWEGLPIVLLEAGASGLPMVVTDVGGNAEIVEDGVSGFVVPPDQPEALADAALRYLRLPSADRAAFADAARSSVVREYAIDRVLDRWEEIYWELLARKRRSWRETG